MEESGPTQVDPTLCKMILNSVEEGDLAKIQANLEKYSIDIQALQDPIKGQARLLFIIVYVIIK